MKKQKILVTGNAGFIGSNLTEELLKQGHSIIGIDNDIKKRHNLNFIIPESKQSASTVEFIDQNFTMIWDDINTINRYNYMLDGIDAVFHLAASADIKKSFENPTMDLQNNVNGTSAILEMIRKRDIKNLIFSSSAAIYGETKIIPTPENVPDIRPISMYGASKIANEAFIHAYNDIYGIKSWIFRFANVVGKREHRGVIFDIFNKLNKNTEELEVLGDGTQRKSFFDVSDCVSGLIDIPQMDKNKSVEIYNLGNPKIMTVKQLVDVVCNEIGVKPKLKFAGGDRGWPGDTPYTILSVEKAMKVGWKPKYSCEQAIKRTVKYLFERK